MEKTKFITIKDLQNRGKTTTIWLLLKELTNRKANVRYIFNINENKEIELPGEMPPQGFLYDVYVILEWNGKVIVIISRGDFQRYIAKDVSWALTQEPDYIICSVQYNANDDKNKIWKIFDKAFLNTQYERVCFWSEYAENAADALLVKQPTVEAIIKYMA